MIPLVVAGVGVGLLVLAGWGFHRGHSNTDWPSTDGRLIEFQPSSKDYWGAGAWLAIRSLVLGAEKPLVRYSYRVEGVSHEGAVLSVGPDNGLDRTERYASGAKIRVFYNPADPSKAVLETGYTRIVYYQAILGLILVSLAITM